MAIRSDLKTRIWLLYAFLIAINFLAWVWAAMAFRGYPLLWGTAFLAYSFGLRHAVDADHIAAIDNVTRKLMQQGKRPLGVGLFFSLGHSTIVIGLSLFIALTSVALQNHFDVLKEVGGTIGTSVSAAFLLCIAFVNAMVLVSVYRTFCTVRRGGAYVEEDIDRVLAQRGFFGPIFCRLFCLIEKSWHMYPLGFLFGLGFDTATEVGLLGISATEATRGLSIWSIMVFPALFTVGMMLVDATDSILMLGVYGWAFVKPIRKLYYNMTITLISVVVAVMIGGIEALGLLEDRFKWQGAVWNAIGSLNDSLGMLGYLIVGIFAVSWLVSILVYRWNRFDEMEAETGPIS